MYIVCGNTDLRKGIDTLAILIADNFGLNLYDDSLFCGRRNDRFKALYWDGEGFILLYKRFDNGRLTWPRNGEEVKALDSQQLNLLLKGLNPLPQPKVHRAKKVSGTNLKVEKQINRGG
ncbi:IS66 family insertion sequence element accessory protein TnpB [Ligilactobacillus agilis]|uniref:IS66 family insertion sequence element accessory protein TnpB n=1 Tax=Ligilactobacillus agilis TaxID=1601 RepID=UPI0022E93318|nr:IS66 family insertion sequence element accessory protein TnpB [Ligilactobacillus agilis]